jgi:hypothetical protein
MRHELGSSLATEVELLAEWSAALQSLLPKNHSARKCYGLNEAAPILVTKNDQRVAFNDSARLMWWLRVVEFKHA